jgi:hypothetical protein
MKLVGLTRKVHDVLQMTKLYTLFDVKDNESAALEAFGAPPLRCCCPPLWPSQRSVSNGHALGHMASASLPQREMRGSVRRCLYPNSRPSCGANRAYSNLQK